MDEPRLRAVLDTAADGVILIDAQGAVCMFNPACERLFGYAADEVISHNVQMLMPSPFREDDDRYLSTYHHTGDRKVIGVGREVVGRRKDGTTFPIDLSVGEATQDNESMFVGIIHDLTERKRGEQAVREVAARLRAVVDTAVDGVILIDAAGSVLMFNPACERLFGHDASEVIGHNVEMLMTSPFRDEHDGHVDTIQGTREVSGRRKDGTTFPMDLSVGEAKQDGQSAFVAIVHDLTARKRTEEQLVQAQKMETVGQLSGGIAHDFNNLLTVMIGNAETLSDKLKVRPDLRQLSDQIIAAGERGAELTQRLLAFSRRQALQPVKIDCNELVEGMRLLLARTVREDINIKAMLDPHLLPAFADPAQLESAILNLALNAQDAMAGGGNLTLSTSDAALDERYQAEHPEVKPGDYVMIAVTDDGEGMPADVLERAFEPFFTTKDVGKGSGLGLSMVYGFVKQSNGHVAIYSEPGLGTTVRLYLPAAAKDGVGAMDAGAHIGKQLPGGHETVLLAEDDLFVRSYAIMCLESLGYQVIPAENGREALAHLTSGAKIDILFTDLVMPGGISGWDLAEQAKTISPGLRVLMTSGYPLETLARREHGRANGNILNKPYRKADLARRLREVLEAPVANVAEA